MTGFVDTNGNGVPDAFENRLSITEILNTECDETSFIAEIEKVPRPPRRGELFFLGDQIKQAGFDYGEVVVANPWKTFIVRRVIFGNVDIST